MRFCMQSSNISVVSATEPLKWSIVQRRAAAKLDSQNKPICLAQGWNIEKYRNIQAWSSEAICLLMFADCIGFVITFVSCSVLILQIGRCIWSDLSLASFNTDIQLPAILIKPFRC